MNQEVIRAYGSEIQEVYERMNQDPGIPGHVRIETRALLNRVFKMGIKVGINIKDRTFVKSELVPTASNTKKWKAWDPSKPTDKKKVVSLERAVAAEKKAADDEVETEETLKAKIDGLGGKYHHKAKIGSLKIILSKLEAKASEAAKLDFPQDEVSAKK